MIKLQNLSKYYPSKLGKQYIFDSINFEIPGGNNIGILGSNGAGKSTLLETIAGLRTPTGGQITLFGQNPGTWRSTGAHKVGVALQSGRPYPSATPQALLNYLHELDTFSPNR